MKKEKRNKLLAVFLVMVMAILLLSGCGGKRAEKEDAETIQPIMKASSLPVRHLTRQGSG